MRRPLRGLLVVVQLVAACAPLADGLLDSATEAAVVHVEAQKSESCLPLHLHDACTLCQHLSQASLLPPAHQPTETSVVPRRHARAITSDLPGGPAIDLERGRAPPQA